MSTQSNIYYTVRPAGDVLLADHREEYLNLMGEHGLVPAPDRRIEHPGGRVELRTDPFRICIWDDEQEAQKFADELHRRTRSNWAVVETEDPNGNE